MSEMDLRWWFSIVTSSLAVALAVTGVTLRVRRIIRYQHVRLPEPVHPLDTEYFYSVRRSTYLRLGVKSMLLVAALLGLFPQVVPLWVLWRIGLVVILALLLAETMGVDLIRNRLARVKDVR